VWAAASVNGSTCFISVGDIRGLNSFTWMSKVFLMAVSFAGHPNPPPKAFKTQKAAGGVSACGFLFVMERFYGSPGRCV
jgi:hypothetical protein